VSSPFFAAAKIFCWNNETPAAANALLRMKLLLDLFMIRFYVNCAVKLQKNFVKY
jgi:hypothetical protein